MDRKVIDNRNKFEQNDLIKQILIRLNSLNSK